ncbi:MAG: hypothetical protein QM586_04700 [Xenophilus sp.]
MRPLLGEFEVQQPAGAQRVARQGIQHPGQAFLIQHRQIDVLHQHAADHRAGEGLQRGRPRPSVLGIAPLVAARVDVVARGIIEGDGARLLGPQGAGG